MYKCEHLLGLIAPTKKFFLLQELSNVRKSLKHAGGIRKLYFSWSRRLEVWYLFVNYTLYMVLGEANPIPI